MCRRLQLVTALWLVSSVTFACAETTTATTKIGIVGGGVSGLGAARGILSSANGKEGKYEVTVFERGGEPVPLQHRLYRNGRVHDMDLIYIPRMNWDGFGVERRWQELLDEFGPIDLVDVSEFNDGGYAELANVMSTEDDVVAKDFSKYKELGPEVALEHLQQIIKAINIFEPYFRENQYSGVAECLKSGLAYGNETFGEWCNRHELPEIHFINGKLLSLYGNLPVTNGPACQVLGIIANKEGAVLGPALQAVLETLSQSDIDPAAYEAIPIPDVAQMWLAGMMVNDLGSFMQSYKYGYADVFRRVIRGMDIDYRTNSEIEQLQATSTGKVKVVSTDGSIHIFDKVIVATRPDQAVGILPLDHPMMRLYRVVAEHAIQRAKLYGVYAVSTVEVRHRKGGKVEQALPRTTSYVLTVRDFAYHFGMNDTVTEADMAGGFTIAPMRIVKQFVDSPIITIVFQVNERLVGSKEERALLESFLGRVGYDEVDIVNLHHYPNTPSYIPVEEIDNGWYEKAEKAQGVDGLYFVGEAHSGHGVPTSWLHAEDFVKGVFALDVATEPDCPTSQSTSYSQNSPIIKLPSGMSDAVIKQVMQTTANRPIEAVSDLGVPPILVIDWTSEFGVMPYLFMWFLLFIILALTGVERLLQTRQAFSSIPSDKRKNISIYVAELTVTTGLVLLAFRNLADLLLFQNPADLVATINTTVTIIAFLNGLYMAELLYHWDGMRQSLKLHHFACILMMQVVTFVYVRTKDMRLLRLGVWNVMFALTEQNVFVSMICYRIFPESLVNPRFTRMHQLSSIVYLLSRVVIAGLNVYAYQLFCSSTIADNNGSIETILYCWFPRLMFPILLLAQVATQWSCFKGLVFVSTKANSQRKFVAVPKQRDWTSSALKRIVVKTDVTRA